MKLYTEEQLLETCKEIAYKASGCEHSDIVIEEWRERYAPHSKLNMDDNCCSAWVEDDDIEIINLIPSSHITFKERSGQPNYPEKSVINKMNRKRLKMLMVSQYKIVSENDTSRNAPCNLQEKRDMEFKANVASSNIIYIKQCLEKCEG